jgi:ribonuclease VapC
MIVDTSAIIAILFKEPDAQTFAAAISHAGRCKISAANFLETSIVVEVHAGTNGGRQFDALVQRTGMVIEPVTEEHARLARQAYLDFGKGRHPAGLNFGDCFSYALSRESGEPLLYKGDDFPKTDIIAATGSPGSGG